MTQRSPVQVPNLHAANALVLNACATPHADAHTARTLLAHLERVRSAQVTEGTVRRALSWLQAQKLLAARPGSSGQRYALTMQGALTWAAWRGEIIDLTQPTGAAPSAPVTTVSLLSSLFPRLVPWGVCWVSARSDAGETHWAAQTYDLQHRRPPATQNTTQSVAIPISFRKVELTHVVADALAVYLGSRFAA